MRRLSLAARLGKWSAAHRWTATGLWLLSMLLIVLAGASLGQRQLTSTQLADGQSRQAMVLLHNAGLSLPANEVVLVHSEQQKVGTPGYTAVLRDVIAAVQGTGQVIGVSTVSNAGLPSGPVSADRHATLIEFDIKGDSATVQDRVEPVLRAVTAAAARHPGFQIAEAGQASFARQATDQLNKGYNNAELISAVATLGILLIVFGALIAALLPLLLAVAALVTAGGLLAVTSHALPVDATATAVMGLVGIATGVDYSLFYVRRFRAELAAGRDIADAVEVAAATSGRSVLVSGMAVLIAMAGLFLAGDAEEIAIAEAAMVVVLAAMAGSVTFLPAMLSLLGHRVGRGRLPGVPVGVLSRRTDRFWALALRVAQWRPAVSALLAGGALAALMVPAFSLHLANSGFSDVPAASLPSLRAYQQIQQIFPNQINTATVVFAPGAGRGTATGRGPVASSAAAQAFVQLVRHTPELPGSVTEQGSPDGTIAFTVGLAGDGTDSASDHALAVLRESVIPRTLGTVPGAQVAVAGTTASSVDYSKQLSARFPLVAAFVLVLTLVMMLLAFRSLLIACLTLALNLLSVGAAYGVIVAVFQYGWGQHLLGFTSVGGITSWVPLFLFVILFGLSMDYHVFVVSSIREEHEAGLDAVAATRRGTLRSAGVITGAATVMVTVAAIFGLLPELSMKETGTGLAVAVFIDSGLVRVVLLPALISVLGERVWWVPRWLRWLPQHTMQAAVPAAAVPAQDERLTVPVAEA